MNDEEILHRTQLLNALMAAEKQFIQETQDRIADRQYIENDELEKRLQLVTKLIAAEKEYAEDR
jgi:hypothetical protein